MWRAGRFFDFVALHFATRKHVVVGPMGRLDGWISVRRKKEKRKKKKKGLNSALMSFRADFGFSSSARTRT
jgi:hypothetical protein